ncbi:MAG TPA: hypothetical protein VI282_04555, partial [Verrucomicrobiae bacterium]
GLTVWENGFALGEAELTYGVEPTNPATGGSVAPTDPNQRTINFGSILELDDIRVGVQNFEVRFGASTSFSGGIFVASGGARFLPGRPISATITHRQNANTQSAAADTEAIRLTLTFTNGHVDSFKFDIDQIKIQLGSFLTLTGVDLHLDTGAADNQEMLHVGSIAAEVSIGSLKIGGEGRNFAFMGDGSFKALPGFGIFLTIGDADGASFQWPSWLPIHINTIGLEWADIEHHPEEFVLTLSASVTGIKGIGGLEFSGSIEGVKIDIGKLLHGQFPIIDIASIGVTVHGNMFGGEIDAGLIGGILKVDDNYNIIGPTDSTTPVKARIFFMGLQGGFKFAGIGVGIRLALSELGPLSVQLSASLPGGVMLVPQAGLVMNDFFAGVEFFKTLPSIDDPFALRGPDFAVPGPVDADTWLAGVKQQVVGQYRAIQANPGMSGFAAAFTAPMLITGSAKIYSIYTSQAVFNAQVVVKFSTDGKLLIIGKLNFAGDSISISGRLYADLSKIASGQATILFLADIPDQVRFLTIYGKLKMGFRNASGEEVTFDVVDPGATQPVDLKPTVLLVDPSGDHIDYNAMNGRKTTVTTVSGTTLTNKGYIDVVFTPPTGANLDYNSILDSDPEFELLVAGRNSPVTVTGDPVPMETVMNADGTMSVQALAPTSEESAGVSARDAMVKALVRTGTKRFRYVITDGSFTQFPRGEVRLHFTAGSFKNADVTLQNGNVVPGAVNDEATISFTVDGATASLSNPGNAGSIDIHVLNGRNYLDVDFTAPAGLGIDASSISDLDPEFTLSGAGLGSARLDLTQAPILLTTDSSAATQRFRYWLTGNFGTGEVWLTYLAGSWGFANATVPSSPGTVTLNTTPGASPGTVILPGTIDITLPAAPDGFSIDPNSVIDLGRELNISVTAGNWTVTLDDTVAPVRVGNTDTYHFAITATRPSASPSDSATVSYTFVAGSWTLIDEGGATGAGVTTGGQIVSLGDLSSTNNRSYIDVIFAPSKGLGADSQPFQLDRASIIEAGTESPEFALTGVGATTNAVTVVGTPTFLGNNTYRYYLQGDFVAGDVSVDFIEGSWTDTGGNSNAAFSRHFTAQGATAEVSNPKAGAAVGTGLINGNHYIEVTFHASNGFSINPDSIDGDEIVLKNAAGATISLHTPTRVAGTDRYRYSFDSDLPTGAYTIEIRASSFQDTGGETNLGSTQKFTVEQPRATLVDPAPGKIMDRETLNNRHTIDITFTPTTGHVLDLDTIMDSGAEFTLTGANGENVVINGTPEDIGNNTFRYTFSGTFDTGKLTVHFIANSWRDKSATGDASDPGNGGAASQDQFGLITQAPAFFIELSGGIELRLADLLDEPLMSVKATVSLDIDNARHVFILQFSGQLTIYKLGTVGATAGRFVLDMSYTLSDQPLFWGVATLETNFSVLEQYGVFLYAKGVLQINTSSMPKTETLTLPGLGPNGTDATRAFNLAPQSFSLELAGQAKIRPPGSSTDLFKMNGGFFLKISAKRFELFVTAELSFGIGDSQITYSKVSGLLMIIGVPEHPELGEIPGVAGRFRVSASAGIGLPNVGDLFKVSGSVSLMFNTTMADQDFTMPDSFVPLLDPGEPTVIHIYKSAPKLDGTASGRPGEVYFVATIQAEIKIAFITLTGFLQISLGSGSGLIVTGAVGTEISFLGALSGTINLVVDGQGVAGRVYLALAANRIPGLQIDGEFLLEINTSNQIRHIETFGIDPATGRFVRNADGTLHVQPVDLAAGPSFKLVLRGKFIIAEVIEIRGEFTFDLNPNGLKIDVDGTLSLLHFGEVEVHGHFVANAEGIVLQVRLSLAAGFGDDIGLKFNANAVFEINTTGHNVD